MTALPLEAVPSAARWPVFDVLDDPERRVMVEVRGVPRPSGYAYVLPDLWFPVNLRPGGSMRSIRSLVDGRIARFPALARYRRQLLTLLRGMVNEAMRRRVERLALFSEPGADGAIAAASCSVLRGGGVELAGGEISNHPHDLADALLAAATRDGELRRPNPDTEVGLVALTQQVAVRSAGLVVVTDPRTGHTAESHQVQYAFPVPGTPGVVMLTFSTPCGWAAGTLTTLFDLIATTFHWQWNG